MARTVKSLERGVRRLSPVLARSVYQHTGWSVFRTGQFVIDLTVICKQATA